MTPWISWVRAFHQKFALPIGSTPALLDDERHRTRMAWIDSENDEADSAQHARSLPESVDAHLDAIFFHLGSLVEMGISDETAERCMLAIYVANMAKEGGGTRADGKILKPEGWQAPNIAAELVKQGWAP